MGFGHQNLPRDERGAMNALKRTDGSPVTRSRRLALRECGIAYRPRGPRRRSRRSSPREGKPHTWRRAAGDGMPRAERYARCGEPTLYCVTAENVASEGYHYKTVSDHRGSNSQAIDFESVKIYP